MLVITREFQVPIATVWSALTDLDQAPAWWGPRGFHTPRESIDADLEVGGFYRACMIQSNTGQEHWYVVWGPFLMAGGALLLGVPVYLSMRSRMAEPPPAPPYR